MTWEIGIIGVATFVVSCALTYLLKGTAKHIGLIDVPNERSSHNVPTPRGGGLAIVVASIGAFLALAAVGVIPLNLCIALCGGGAMVATIGLIDDCRSLSASIRLLIHFLAAAWAVAWLGPITRIEIGSGSFSLGVFAYPLSILAIVWFLNMFNFMDGIDGLAASQSVFMCAALALLSWTWGERSSVLPSAIIIGTASAGFLLWNWTPAKIFLGDIGSGYLGFSLALLGLGASHHEPTAPFSWLIVAGVFAVDATYTVIRRFLRGERVTQAHRTHGFQLLAQRVGHRNTTLLLTSVNVFWLMPCALMGNLLPSYTWAITALALTPIIGYALVIGAGRPDRTQPQVASTRATTAKIVQFQLAARHKTPVINTTPRHAITAHAYSDSTIPEGRSADAECVN